MVTAVRSLGLQGISGYEVTVECFLSGGLPAFDIVGLGDTAVKESRERVRAAGCAYALALRLDSAAFTAPMTAGATDTATMPRTMASKCSCTNGTPPKK